MRILVICQYYFPEPFRVNDFCEELARHGHDVTVITGEPNYPEGKIYSGYENHSHSDEIINGVKVHRCPIIPRKTGSIYRLLNYFSYPRKAKKYVKKLIVSHEEPFDIVFVNQLSPVMMAQPALFYKAKTGTPVVLYCLDLWPESLLAGGVKRGSMVYRFFHSVSKRIYRKADRILVTSRLFSDYLNKEFGVTNSGYLPQYAEGLFEKLPFRCQDGTINFVLAGNIGVAQSVETVVKAAEKLKDESVHFHIVGSGIDLERLQNMAKGLKNITFYGRRPLDEMPKFYAMADALLVTLQADPVLSLTIPGKVQTYMAVGKPIIGAIDGETARVIKETSCGYCGKAEDADELADNIRSFIKCPNKHQMGDNARSFYETNFAREMIIDKLEKELVSASTEYKRK